MGDAGTFYKDKESHSSRRGADSNQGHYASINNMPSKIGAWQEEYVESSVENPIKAA